MRAKIAILGWGSLLWDQHEEFDDLHDEWSYDGPPINLEFSRISRSRDSALTLVVDPTNGTETIVAYCVSSRSSLEAAVNDLRRREGTTMKNIGYLLRGEARANFQDKASCDAIRAWSERKGFDVVIWTDLKSNFSDVKIEPYSVEAAIAHIQGLDEIGKAKAKEYV